MSQQVIMRELSKPESQEYIDRFQRLEYSYRVASTDWYGSEDANFYIWLIDITSEPEIPIGFIGYKVFALDDGEAFIYIVKFFVLKEYKKYNNRSNVKLVEGEKVSSLLFKEIKSKGMNIITLTSANSKLDIYYTNAYGFTHNEQICGKLADIIGEFSEGLLYLEVIKKNFKVEDNLKNLFG